MTNLRRRDIIDGIVQVLSALKTSRIAELLLGFPGQDRVNPTALLGIFQSYILATQHYGQAAKEVSKIFGLEPLREVGFWGDILASDNRASGDELRVIYADIHFALNHLPKFLTLLEQESDTLKTSAKSNVIFTVLLPEEGQQHSKPQRIADLMAAVSSIYEGLAMLEGKAANTLSLVSCDSGSDKSFDFLGPADVVEGVKELLLSLWDRVVFYRELQLSRRLELIAESLPVLERINKLEGNGSLGREQGEIVRRRIIDGCNKFLACGATIPEMEERSYFNPRILMCPEPKPLTGDAPPRQDSEDDSIKEDDSINSEENPS